MPFGLGFVSSGGAQAPALLAELCYSDGTPLDAPRHHVVRSAVELKSQWPGHGRTIALSQSMSKR